MMDFPNAQLPELKPLKNSFVVDDVENDLRNLFIDLFELMLAEQSFDANVLGMAHLGSLDLVRKMINADGLSMLDVEREETTTRYLYKAWKSRRRNGRGFHFLRTYLQMLFPNVHYVEQMAQSKAHAYPTKLSALQYADSSKYSTSRIRVSIQSPDITWDEIDKMEPILRSIIPARLVLYFAKLSKSSRKNYIGATMQSGSYSTIYPAAANPIEWRKTIHVGAVLASTTFSTIYPKVENNLLSDLYAGMGENIAGTVLQGNPVADWTQRGVIGMGNKCRGDYAPNWWTPANPSFKLLVPWQAATCWFVIWPTTSHQAVNTGVNIRDLEVWILRDSTDEWELVNLSQVAWPPPSSLVAQRDEPNGSKSFFLSGQKNSGTVLGTNYAVHGSSARFPLSGGDDIKCLFMRYKAKLVLQEPSVPDDRHKARIHADIGLDYWPTITTLTGEFAPSSYNPGAGSSRWEMIGEKTRYVQYATVNPPADGLGFPAGSRAIARSIFEENLPPPLRLASG
jgi:hypothetical protein